MIEVVSGFKFTDSTDPLDGRNNFPTIAEMKACEICDEGHITFCEATGKTYRFVSKNTDGTSKTKDSTYGYWEEFEIIALNDLSDKTDNLTKDIESLERVTSSSLNDLDEKIDDLNDKTDNLTKDVEDLEKTTSSSLNDLNEKVDDLTDKIDDNELITASALADLDDKIKYEIKTTNNITNPTKNTYYDLTSLNLTSLDLTSISLTNINEVVVKFTTDSTITCTISAPANVKFIGNSVLYKGTTYVLAMLYGVICICEAPSLT